MPLDCAHASAHKRKSGPVSVVLHDLSVQISGTRILRSKVHSTRSTLLRVICVRTILQLADQRPHVCFTSANR